MGSSTVTELLDFTGGMNTVTAPHLVDRREALDLVNVDITLGALQSMTELEYIQLLEDGPYFFQFNNKIYSYPDYRCNVLWDNKWFWSDGTTTGKVLEDGTEYDLGLPTPSVTLSQVLNGAGPHTGNYKYTYTFYSTVTGAESAPAPLPNYLVVEDNAITLDNFEALPANADRYRLYRIGGYLPIFTLVATLLDTQPPYVDVLDDTQVDGRILGTLYAGPPPVGLDNLIEMNGRFYGTIGTKLYYSALGNPDSWYISNYFIMQDNIVGLAKSPGGLIVLGRFYVSLLIGTDANNFRLKVLSDQLGCIGKESIAHIGDSAMWLSHKAFCMTNGYTITDITSHKIDDISGIFPTSAVVDNQVYYMSFKPDLFPAKDLYPADTLFPSTVLGTSVVEEGIIAIDFRRGSDFSYKTIIYENVRYVGIANGGVHVGNIGALTTDCSVPMFTPCDESIFCSSYVMSRMNVDIGQALMPLYYKSPFLIDGSITTIKEYDKIRITFKGTFLIKVLFDNGYVVLKQKIESLEETKFTLLGIPNARNKSHHISFEVYGTGVITGIQYSWKPRELVN